ncbi:hypothetical protein BDW22DRAFT_1426171 [Trametopsis cervina]|nr:hypothetical protein BDW22DRAFT_1426171 [Trametopsis cervina]
MPDSTRGYTFADVARRRAISGIIVIQPAARVLVEMGRRCAVSRIIVKRILLNDRFRASNVQSSSLPKRITSALPLGSSWMGHVARYTVTNVDGRFCTVLSSRKLLTKRCLLDGTLYGSLKIAGFALLALMTHSVHPPRGSIAHQGAVSGIIVDGIQYGSLKIVMLCWLRCQCQIQPAVHVPTNITHQGAVSGIIGDDTQYFSLKIAVFGANDRFNPRPVSSRNLLTGGSPLASSWNVSLKIAGFTANARFNMRLVSSWRWVAGALPLASS